MESGVVFAFTAARIPKLAACSLDSAACSLDLTGYSLDLAAYSLMLTGYSLDSELYLDILR
jgi:hypothetical protein